MPNTGNSKKDIIDAFIAEATNRLFTGDKRDGSQPPITLKNFYDQSFRYGAKALRARLSRLSRTELLGELNIAATYVDERQARTTEYIALADQHEREAATHARRERQAELGRRHGLQPALVAAARHYRTLGKNAKQAWHAITVEPFATPSGETVIIEGIGKEQCMCVQSRGGKQQRSGIKMDYWQRRYWPLAGKVLISV
jgi:hypothetical protein